MKLEFFTLYPEKFLSSVDVQTMTPTEFGVYCKLLFASYLQERQCYFEYNEEKITKLCNLTTNQMQEVRPMIQRKFKRDGNYIYNETLLQIFNREKKGKKEQKAVQYSLMNSMLNYAWEDFWNDYDKKRGSADRLIPKWIKLTDAEREAIRAYIPKYKEAEPNKSFRLNVETFLNQRGWEMEIIHKTKKETSNVNSGEYKGGGLS